MPCPSLPVSAPLPEPLPSSGPAVRTAAGCRRLLLGLLLLVAATAPAGARSVEYRLRMDRETRTWEVRAVFPRAEPGAVDFWIPRWQPGAYHLAEYGRWVQELGAATADGEALPVERLDDCHWRIPEAPAGLLVVEYRARSMSSVGLGRDVIDVEANRIARRYAYVSPASLLGFLPETLELPVELTVELPEGWRTASALEEVDGVLQAPSYYRLEDSPLFFSATHGTVEFPVQGVPHAVTVYGLEPDEAEAIAADCRRLVEAASELFQVLPYPRYHFLVGFVTAGVASGLEHSNSTLILFGRDIPRAIRRDVLAHELVHAWLGERIRVRAFAPPDYRVPVETESLWLLEGGAEYLGRLVALQAGLVTREEFLDRFARELWEARAVRPVAQSASWSEVSRQAAYWRGPQDLMLFALKSYQFGPSVILALDLEMRRASEGERGLVDLARFLCRAHALPDRPLEEEALVPLINGIAQADLTRFHDRFIAGTDLPELDEALAVIGYRCASDEVVPVDQPTEQQVRAREDFFSLPPAAGR